MKIVTRGEALAAGLSRYYTGKACSHGHVAERGSANKTCVVCASAQRIKKQTTYNRTYNVKHFERIAIKRDAFWSRGRGTVQRIVDKFEKLPDARRVWLADHLLKNPNKFSYHYAVDEWVADYNSAGI